MAINDLMDSATAAYLLQYDTVYGRFEDTVTAQDAQLSIGKKTVPKLCIKNPTELPWRSLGVDVVIEATGAFTTYERAYAHIVAGAQHTIITAPAKGMPPANVTAATVLIGLNTEKAKACSITSNASCTTNAVGIPLRALHQALGIESALLTTVHGYTNSQPSVDSPTVKKNNLRFGRSAAMNIIPATTGAALATTAVLTDLEQSFDGVALRVPISVGSLIDLTCVMKKPTSVQEVNTVLQRIDEPLFSTTEAPLVSSDIIGECFVSIADLSMTKVVNGTLVKVFFWYDNEMGYAQSLIEHTRSV